MSIAQRLALLIVLWLPFTLAGIGAAVISFTVVSFGNHDQQQGYGKDVLRAMDKVLAAVLGYSGQYTTSAELGVDDPARNRFGFRFAALRWLLDKIQPGHCVGAAVNEGLLVLGVN